MYYLDHLYECVHIIIHLFTAIYVLVYELNDNNVYKCIYIYICNVYIYIVNVTLTSARCDTVFHIRR